MRTGRGMSHYVMEHTVSVTGHHDKTDLLRFELLGAFECEGHAIPRKTGKKGLSFLQYLLVNHTRSISSEELIGQFWSESRDPASALRNMLFKTRILLKQIFPEQKQPLLTLQDCYAWDPKLKIVLDTEELEGLCFDARGKRIGGEEYCELLCRAVSFYKGDFLPGNDSEWARTLRQYYRTLYLDSCRALLPLLYERERWLEVVTISEQAYGVDFGTEDFTAWQMQALIALGQPEQAVEKYEVFRTMLRQEFELMPTRRIEQLHALAKRLRTNAIDHQEIFRLVCGQETDGRAFFCTFGTFQSIVSLERRHLARSGQNSTLVIVSLGDGAATVPDADARRLEHVLLEGLRTGDPVARLEAGSYILMLTGSDEESAHIVTSRIDGAFHRAYRHSGANLTFRVAALEPGGGVK